MRPSKTRRAIRILLLEDSADVALQTIVQLRRQGLELDWEHVQTADAFASRLDSSFDAIIADYHVPGAVVRAVLAITRQRFPDLPFIVISAAMSADEGVELMRLGAQDYLSKRGLKRLGPSLTQACSRARERQEARSIESRYRNLFEQMPVGVVRSSPGGETVDINAALLKILRFPDEATFREEIGLLMADLISDDARDEITGKLTRDGLISGFETEVRRRDGTVAWMRVDIGVVYGEDGDRVSYDTVVIDVDDRKRAEADLRWSDSQRRQLLKRVITAQEEERQRIAQGIHDDAVQVMSAAHIHLAVLGQKIDDDKLAAEVDRLIDAISQSTARLRDLLFELQPPALVRSGLVAALREQLNVFCRDTVMDWNLTGQLAREPSRDRGILLYRIAQEALSNIRKHAEASRIEVSVGAEDEGILVRIRDDGRGFDPPARGGFAQPGHMGLASMAERAALVGGWCTVQSSPGAGATVSMWIPSSDSSVSIAPVVEDGGTEMEGRSISRGAPPSSILQEVTKVLVVEDHPMVAQALRRLLDGAPDLQVVDVAENASDALRYASEYRPDVVVMDSNLAGVSGAQAASEIRAAGPATAILFFSADDSDSAILDAVEAGASGYLNKGSPPELVLEAVRRVAAGEMLISAAVLARLITGKRAAAMSAAQRARAIAQFTDRELEVLSLMGEGLDSSAISARLFVELSTVRWHVRNILDKLQAHSRLEAVAIAAQLGILER